MMRCLRFVGITFAVCALGGLARAGEPTLEQIIERALRAHGGEDRLNQLTGFHSTIDGHPAIGLRMKLDRGSQ